MLMQAGGRLPVFVIDLRRPEVLKPIVPEGTTNQGPIWNTQGDKIAFGSDSGAMPKVLVQAISGGSGNSCPRRLGYFNRLVSGWTPHPDCI